MNRALHTADTAWRCPRHMLQLCVVALVLSGQMMLPTPADADGDVTCWPGPDGIQVCITIPGTGANPGGAQQPPGGGNPPPPNGGQPPSGGGSVPPASGVATNPLAGVGGPGFGLGQPQGACAVAAVMGQPCAAPPPPVANTPPPPVAPPPPIPVDPLAEALRLCAAIQLPEAQVHINPNLGLVNLPSWFWLEGYTGQALTASETTQPPYEVVTIEVRAFPARVTWSYGDDSPPVSFGDGSRPLDLQWFGQAYPVESAVAHTYAFSSLAFPEGFPIRLAVEWAVEYRVNGGAYQQLGVVLARDYLGNHRVQEIQSLITDP